MTEHDTDQTAAEALARSRQAAENERLVRRYFGAVWNENDLDVFDTDLVAPGDVLHHRSAADYDVDELRAAWANWYEAFPDLANDVEDLLATHDRVVVRYRFTGTHRGPAMGVPATGRRVETAGIVIFALAGGQLVERWARDDDQGLLGQLDAGS